MFVNHCSLICFVLYVSRETSSGFPACQPFSDTFQTRFMSVYQRFTGIIEKKSRALSYFLSGPEYNVIQCYTMLYNVAFDDCIRSIFSPH